MQNTSAEEQNATVLDNRFVLEKKLGSGGMGVVYLAYDQMFEKQVAVKFVTAELTDEIRQRFIQEAHLMEQYRSPNIADVKVISHMSRYFPLTTQENVIDIANKECFELENLEVFDSVQLAKLEYYLDEETGVTSSDLTIAGIADYLELSEEQLTKLGLVYKPQPYLVMEILDHEWDDEMQIPIVGQDKEYLVAQKRKT